MQEFKIYFFKNHYILTERNNDNNELIVFDPLYNENNEQDLTNQIIKNNKDFDDIETIRINKEAIQLDENDIELSKTYCQLRVLLDSISLYEYINILEELSKQINIHPDELINNLPDLVEFACTIEDVFIKEKIKNNNIDSVKEKDKDKDE